jgi:hypothetical protein
MESVYLIHGMVDYMCMSRAVNLKESRMNNHGCY